jgi:phage shock protein PspC (stress-responsive transcriptional regulator)
VTDAPRNPDSPEPGEQPTAPTEWLSQGDPLGDGPERPGTSGSGASGGGGPEQPGWGGAGARRLTRSTSDTVIGGVAGGLGRYFSVDPILFRIGFVLLTFMGGLGVLAYLAMLAFVPTDGDDQGAGTGKVGAVAGAVALGVALVIFLGPPLFFFGPGLLVVAVVGVAGVLLWRALGGEPGGDPARTAARIAVACLIAVGCFGAAVGVGLAAALGGGVVIASLAVVAGLALIGTAFVGGARWLIVPAVALVLPLGIVAAAGIDLDGGIGERDYRPVAMSELQDSYDVGIGSMDVDLRDLQLPDDRRTDVTVDVGLGGAVVWVPRGACVTSDVRIGAGGADVLERESEGVDVSLANADTAPVGKPHLHVNADIGIGVIEIVREGDRPDYVDHEWRDRTPDGPPQDAGCAA